MTDPDTASYASAGQDSLLASAGQNSLLASADADLLLASAQTIAERTGVDHHDVAVVLGSGWAPAVAELGDPVAVVPMAAALTARAVGLVVGTILGVIAALIGRLLGALAPTPSA